MIPGPMPVTLMWSWYQAGNSHHWSATRQNYTKFNFNHITDCLDCTVGDALADIIKLNERLQWLVKKTKTIWITKIFETLYFGHSSHVSVDHQPLIQPSGGCHLCSHNPTFGLSGWSIRIKRWIKALHYLCGYMASSIENNESGRAFI